MKTEVTLKVPIDESWGAGIRLQVFSNGGSGDVDTDTPLLPRAKNVFPGALEARGYGIHPYCGGRYGTNLPSRLQNGGYGDHVYAGVPYGTSQPYIEIAVHIPATFGKWKFGVAAVDEQGNVQGDSVEVIERMISATEPPTLKSLALDSYDGENDQVTLSFGANTE